jgi:hypothetical protein
MIFDFYSRLIKPRSGELKTAFIYLRGAYKRKVRLPVSIPLRYIGAKQKLLHLFLTRALNRGKCSIS